MYLQRESTMSCFPSTTSLADVRVVLTECLLFENFKLGVKSVLETKEIRLGRHVEMLNHSPFQFGTNILRTHFGYC